MKREELKVDKAIDWTLTHDKYIYFYHKSEADKVMDAMEQRIKELEAENAELKKQVPVWHSVADGDLPSNGRDVLAFTGFYHHIDNYHGFYMNEHHWRVYDDETHWCELPKAPAKKKGERINEQSNRNYGKTYRIA